MYTLLIFLLTIIGWCYWFVKKRHNYWTDRGIPSIKPRFPSGSLSGVGSTTYFGEKIAEHYRTLKGKGVIGGLHFFIYPTALILDLDLLRNVFIKDFQYFPDRGVYVNEKADPLTAHLASISGEHWKRLRGQLTPTFSPGKMKMMHKTVMIVAEQFKEHLDSITKVQKEVEMKPLCASFTTDIIANVVFGLECNSLKDPGNEFKKYGTKYFDKSTKDYINQQVCITFPKFAKFLNLRMINREISDFFMETIRKTVEYREKNNVQRNDFLQLLMQIKNKGKLEGETEDLGKSTFNELAAQTYIFFLAGFETSSSTMTFSSYELAMNQDIQNRAREEIREVLKRHNGEMSYEAVLEMTYVDQIIQETLRKYPIAAVLRRKVHAAYRVPGTDIVLPEDMITVIPVLGIHRDPEFYPDPEKFDPERFTKENISKRHPFAYLPFGEGPRNCIGLRFGMMQTKVGLATLLNNYRLSASDRTPRRIEYSVTGNIMVSVGGMFLKMEMV